MASRFSRFRTANCVTLASFPKLTLLGFRQGQRFSTILLPSRPLSTDHIKAPRICIVGSGPAGFYTAQQILKLDKRAIVDIYERSPVPFGLVRFGVAPDHPEVKNVINTFQAIAENNRCNFYGNVNVGVDVKTKDLRAIYDGVVLAYGADKDKTLGISGEELDGVLSARAFVGWYNGMPAHKDLNPNLSTETAVVVGHGNVAIDVARILLSPFDSLKYTDICSHALDVLQKSSIRNVLVAGRRGPLEAAFTIKEIRELINLPECRTMFRKDDFDHARQVVSTLPRPKKRLIELMCKTAFSDPTQEDLEKKNKLFPVFFRSPVEILGNGNKVTGVVFEINELRKSDDGSTRAVGTGKFEEVECGLVLRSIGYRSIKVDDGIPFDSKMGFIPNNDGRVVEEAGSNKVIKGLYCSGWVKHGPVGVILTTMVESKATGNVIVEDLKDENVNLKGLSDSDLHSFLESKGVKPLTYIDWQKIDEEETKRGAEVKKPREKIVSENEMIDVALKNKS